MKIPYQYVNIHNEVDAIDICETMKYTCIEHIAEEYTRYYSIEYTSKVVITITMYNEDEHLFLKTLNALIKNIEYLCDIWKYTKSDLSYKDILICIISDGREKINTKVLDILYLLGLYLNIPFHKINEQGYQYEYTLNVRMNEKCEIKKNKYPIQCMFFLKEENKKKINSHRWLFKGFCNYLQPEIVLLIDVGTVLDKDALYHIWYEFSKDKNIAGVCGEIYVDSGQYKKRLLNILVAAQNFEYKISNILDKPFESIMGYITVLPGAFSAYRYEPITKVVDQYLKGEYLHGNELNPSELNVFSANMYLAEDRVLCFNLLTHSDNRYKLKYIKSAKAKTDVPDNIYELISQRRRWLNGTFFASMYAILNFYKIFQTNHNFINIMLFLIQTIFNLIINIVSYFQVSLFYLTFNFLLKSYSDTIGIPIIFSILNFIYITLIVLLFLLSLGNRPQGIKVVFLINVILFSIMMIFIIYLVADVIYNTLKDTSNNLELLDLIINNEYFRNITMSILFIYGIYVILGLLYIDILSILTCIIQYYILIPLYINVFTIYSICNIHDITWGTKGVVKINSSDSTKTLVYEDNNQYITYEEYNTKYLYIYDNINKKEQTKSNKQPNKEDYFRKYRTNFLIIYLILNGIIIGIFTNDDIRNRIKLDMSSEINPFLTFILYYVVGIHAIKFIGSFIYIIKWYITETFIGILRQYKKLKFRYS